MQNNHHFHLCFPLFLLLSPPFVAAQDSFKGNAGEPFTPSTVIIIIMGIIFMFTGCLAVFLRQFSHGCFGLNVTVNPAFTADGHLATHGLDPEYIKTIPTYFYSDVKQHRKGHVELECAVCLSEFQDPEALRLLPGCSHVFHPRCIDQWLATHVTCPICRLSLEPDQSGGPTKPAPNTVVIRILPDTRQQYESDDGSDHYHEQEDHDVKKIIEGKFPRSHSTGHSMADPERFTLVLPEEVQSNLPNRSKFLSSILSPRSAYRCGWFSMTPPLFNARSRSVRSMVSSGLVINGSKNPALPPVKTSDRLWPI